MIDAIELAHATGINNLLAEQLGPPQSREGILMNGSPYNQVPPGEVPPTRAGVQVPIGNNAGSLSNKLGNKFTRGWLAGHGGADIEHGLGANAFDVRPANYNCKTFADFRAVVPEYGAPVAGLANSTVHVEEQQHRNGSHDESDNEADCAGRVVVVINNHRGRIDQRD